MCDELLENITIGNLREDDVEQILNLHQSVNLGYWSEADYKEILNKAEYVCYTARQQNILIGFVNARLIKYEQLIEIINIAVLPTFRKKGVARQLLGKLFKFCEANEIAHVFLEARESNSPALRFYEKTGFSVVGRRRNFYENPPEDALLLKLDF